MQSTLMTQGMLWAAAILSNAWFTQSPNALIVMSLFGTIALGQIASRQAQGRWEGEAAAE